MRARVLHVCVYYVTLNILTMKSKMKFGCEFFAAAESETFVVSVLVDPDVPQKGTENLIFSSADEFLQWLRK